jgi:hypothetical protein
MPRQSLGQREPRLLVEEDRETLSRKTARPMAVAAKGCGERFTRLSPKDLRGIRATSGKLPAPPTTQIPAPSDLSTSLVTTSFNRPVIFTSEASNVPPPRS